MQEANRITRQSQQLASRDRRPPAAPKVKTESDHMRIDRAQAKRDRKAASRQ